MPGQQRFQRKWETPPLDKGMIRHMPRHLIPDNAVWLAENVRFDVGKIKPILDEAQKATFAVDSSNRGLFCLDYWLPTSARIGDAPVHFIAYQTVIGGPLHPLYIYTGDIYNTLNATLNLTVGAAKAKPSAYGDLTVFGKFSYLSNMVLKNEVASGFLVKWDKGAGTATEVRNAAGFRHLRMFENFLNTQTVTGDVDQWSWSDFGAPDTWTGGQSGSKNLTYPMAGMEVLKNYLVYYLHRGIYRVSFVGVPTIWNVEEVSRDIGVYNGALGCKPCLEKHSLNYFISDYETRNVFLFDGTNMKQIGLPIRDHLFALADGNEDSQVIVAPNVAKNEIAFFVTKDIDTVGTTSHVYLYNYITGAWSYFDLTTAVVANIQYMLGFTRRFAPDMRFAVEKLITGTRYIYVYACDAGTTMKIPTVETKTYDLKRPEIYKRVLQLDIILDKGVNENFNIYVAGLDNPDDTPSWGAAHVLNFSSSGSIYPDISGRYFVVKITTAATAYSTIWEFVKLRFHYQERGFK